MSRPVEVSNGDFSGDGAMAFQRACRCSMACLPDILNVRMVLEHASANVVPALEVGKDLSIEIGKEHPVAVGGGLLPLDDQQAVPEHCARNVDKLVALDDGRRRSSLRRERNLRMRFIDRGLALEDPSNARWAIRRLRGTP
jgi:hypothetical protein